MSLITRQGKGSKLTIAEMDGNLNYLDATRNYVAETGTFAVSGLRKVKNYNLTVQGTEFDVYNFQAQTELDGSNVYIYPIGYITTSSPTVGIASDKSAVQCQDTNLDFLETSLGVSALVTDSLTGDAVPVSFMAINIDNNITTPDEYYIFLIAADGINFECRVSINIELVATKGSIVEYAAL